MASVMTYSGAAAVHALALVSIRWQLLSFGGWYIDMNQGDELGLPAFPQV